MTFTFKALIKYGTIVSVFNLLIGMIMGMKGIFVYDILFVAIFLIKTFMNRKKGKEND